MAISVENIRVMESSLNGFMATMLKCRKNLGVTSLRAPPGGPMAARNWISAKTILLVSFKSYLERSKSQL